MQRFPFRMTRRVTTSSRRGCSKSGVPSLSKVADRSTRCVTGRVEKAGMLIIRTRDFFWCMMARPLFRSRKSSTCILDYDRNLLAITKDGSTLLLHHDPGGAPRQCGDLDARTKQIASTVERALRPRGSHDGNNGTRQPDLPHTSLAIALEMFGPYELYMLVICIFSILVLAAEHPTASSGDDEAGARVYGHGVVCSLLRRFSCAVSSGPPTSGVISFEAGGSTSRQRSIN